MGWQLGEHNGRDIGYGVPATCDQPGCGASIDRGLDYVCGDEPYGGDHGCGLFFCEAHRAFTFFDVDGKPFSGEGESDTGATVCERCAKGEPAFEPTPDVAEWIRHKETDPSWAAWRAERAAVRA